MANGLEDMIELSDEEFMAQEHAFSTAAAKEIDAPDEPVSTDDDGANAEADQATEEQNEIDDTDADETVEGKLVDEQTEDKFLDKDAESDESQKGETDSNTEDEAEDTSTDESESDSDSEVDYKAEYEKLLAPFKANGRTIKVDSAEDAISLMQMGANYNKKMSDLKPHLKIVKTLESNGLLDADRINELIDISNKDVGAIKKLVKDSGIDTFDLDSDEENTYKPKDHQIDDKTYSVNETLDAIRDTDKFDVTSDIVGTQWDAASRAALYENPGIINVIHQHVQSGHYDVVADKVENLRVLGKIPAGTSNLDAYGVVAKQLADESAAQEQQAPTQKDVQKPVLQADLDRDKKRKAAGSTKKTPKSVKPSLSESDVLAMSDEEFATATKDGLFKTV